MKHKIKNYIRAGYAGIYIISPEEVRVEAEFQALTEEIGYELFAWSPTQGMLDTKDGSLTGNEDPMECLEHLGELPEKSVVLLRDFHLFLEDSNPVLLRSVKDQVQAGRVQSRVLVVVACRLALPPELSREFVVLDFSLPGKDDIETIAKGIASSAGIELPDGQTLDQLLEAAAGLTSIEAENGMALAVVETGTLAPAVVAREKANEIRKSEVLEVCNFPDNLDSVGGLDDLKAWLVLRRNSFGREAQAYRLPTPKGVLIVGIPGTGKSLTAKATAAVFGRPLLRLDVGRLFGSLVGQSEANLRSAIATVEAVAPCVLWIDELEKGFSGSKSSGSSDGGTSSRVFGTFLSWMQDRSSPVFVVATANDVSQMPPEFLRKGRFDELFFVDLPNQTEREAIWRIQVQKYGRDPDSFQISRLAKATEGFTGAEIEQAFRDSLHAGFSHGQEPDDLLLGEAIAQQTPLSKLMGEEIQAMRKWSRGRARLATKTVKSAAGRKIQTGNN